MSGILTLSPAACSRVRELRATQAAALPYFRVYITGGGCSGFQYKFMLDEIQEEDLAWNQEDIALVVDPLTLSYLQGAQVDFVRDLRGARFAVTNPNATTTCSCGSSFSVD